jgi:hypothetical protein
MRWGRLSRPSRVYLRIALPSWREGKALPFSRKCDMDDRITAIGMGKAASVSCPYGDVNGFCEGPNKLKDFARRSAVLGARVAGIFCTMRYDCVQSAAKQDQAHL